MCGIVGYVGPRNSKDIIVDGLKKLEYRGYDSAGIALLRPHGSSLFIKEVGEVSNIENKFPEQSKETAYHCGIGHTRWATHGEPSALNAHPHTNKGQTIFVVHNGIIENHQAIKKTLSAKGYSFISMTDTEAIPQLLDYNLAKYSDCYKAFEHTISELEGAYAITAVFEQDPEHIYVARLSSPLVIGVGAKEHVVASDQTALDPSTKKVIFLGDYEIAKIGRQSLEIKNIKDGRSVDAIATEIDREESSEALGKFPHYMLKEIHDIPETIESATSGRVRSAIQPIKLGGLESVKPQLDHIDRIVIIACGTSYYAGMVGEYLIEEIAGIPVEVQLASEFKYREEPFSRSTAIIAISQSGETADTIAGLEKVREYGVLTLGIVNVVGSTISRITDAGVYCHAGPEKSVASTKAFVAQVTVLTEIALLLAKDNYKSYRSVVDGLQALPDVVRSILKDTNSIQKTATKYSKFKDVLYIGRGYLYPCALEGALKLKEVSYIHAEGYASGEMKHGPLAMIDEDFATVALACDGPYLEKTISNIEEIRARKGPVLAIATEGNTDIKHFAQDVLYTPEVIPQLQPIAAAVILQLFAYFVAVEKGLNVDRPRNLAKSVTVE